ncbi:MAG: GAF domain-containing sensor histidine kinase [Salinirussus sp.]
MADEDPSAIPDRSSEAAALKQLYRITADHERPFEEKVRELLDLGRSYLGVQVGFLTEIEDGTQLIVEAVGDHEELQPGESCPLSKAYCRKTIERDTALTVQHAAVEGWEGDAAYEAFGLESYIGATVIVDGEVNGTFCFADKEPRDEPFTDAEETVVELMAKWVSYELFQQRATERIQRQRDRLEEFASVVSHDLRNPLSVLEASVDLAEETGESEHFERCRNAIERMGTLIDDLLVLAREGEAISETEPGDLASAIEECWSFVGTADATLKVSTERRIQADWARLQQLFENLFRNAIEHGGTDVTVTVGDLPDGSGIFIEDDGPGIPPEDRERVFEDGFSMSEGGTGFGLVIVEEIVDAHGWEITATEGSDGGARFEITGMER